MIWIILATIGVPLWLCSVAILTLVLRNRNLRHRRGDIPVRRRLSGETRWGRGHGVWVHDVFAYRSSPAGWSETLAWVAAASTRSPADAGEAKKLRKLGDAPMICVMSPVGGATIEFAASVEHAVDLLGPFAFDAASGPRSAPR